MGWVSRSPSKVGPGLTLLVTAGLVGGVGCLVPVSAGSDFLPGRGDASAGAPAVDAGAADGGATRDAGWSGAPEVFCFLDCFTGEFVRADGGDTLDAGGFCGSRFVLPPCTCARVADGGVDYTCWWGCSASHCFESNCGDITCGSGTVCVERGRCE